MSQKIIHRAGTRGFGNHEWLKTHHTFCFADYYDPERIHFGALRVLNDDEVAPGMGFPEHSHDNMEIISIPLEGDLEHKDSMGNTAVIRHGDVQVMSAGTGIRHSEYNHSKDAPVKFLQIWVFPREECVQPRYGQMTHNVDERKNRFQQIVSPDSVGGGLWIHQDAWFNLAKMDKDITLDYKLKREHDGVYIFVLEGEVIAEGVELKRRDGMGIWETREISITATAGAEILLMEVPMFD